MSAQGVELIAISTDDPDVSRLLRKKLSVGFRFLSDPEAELLDVLGIRHKEQLALEEHGKESIAFPTMILVDATGRVRWIFETDSIRSRADPEEVLTALADMQGG